MKATTTEEKNRAVAIYLCDRCRFGTISVTEKTSNKTGLTIVTVHKCTDCNVRYGVKKVSQLNRLNSINDKKE